MKKNIMSELDQDAVDYFAKLDSLFPSKKSHKSKLKLTAIRFCVTPEYIQRILNDWAGIKELKRMKI